MKKIGLIILSAACMSVAFAAGSAYADSKPVSHSAAPWYERFTFGSEFESGVNAWSPRSDAKASLKFSPKSKWGVTFGMKEQSQRPNDLQKGQTSAGAFYDLSKNFRIGGQVVLPQDNFSPVDRNKKDKSGPSVKVESAFRF